MAKKKKQTLTMLGDIQGAMLGNFTMLEFCGEMTQCISVHTEAEYRCSVCGTMTTALWTMNRAFVTSAGGNLMPAYTLCCGLHGPAIPSEADDYVSPGDAPQGKDDTEESTTDEDDTEESITDEHEEML